MCIYCQKKICVTPRGVNGAPNVPQLYASGGINISKSIESRRMKLTTLVNYIYIYMCVWVCVCVQSRMQIRVMNVFFLFNFF